MKKRTYFIAIVLVSIFASCKTQKNLRERLFLVEDYKKVYFGSCLGYGFNRSKAIIEILQQDNSISSEYLQGRRNYRIIDSLAKLTAKEIKLDSIAVNYDETRGKRVFSKCLKGYNSKFLDSMAKTTYKLKVKKYKHFSEYKYIPN
ncbi:MAG: hypothetical protein V3V28_02275 [Polaribacter sp.]|uniref:hypothetical protein n=1 Tax=Polaribacter sp. TaxID=1920175 RepID=UPI002F35D0C8